MKLTTLLLVSSSVALATLACGNEARTPVAPVAQQRASAHECRLAGRVTGMGTPARRTMTAGQASCAKFKAHGELSAKQVGAWGSLRRITEDPPSACCGCSPCMCGELPSATGEHAACGK